MNEVFSELDAAVHTVERSAIRGHYDELMANSETEYKIAGIALQERNYGKYKLHVDRSWDYAERAGTLLPHMTDEERREIKRQALESMATAFVRGLGRAS